MPPIAKECTSIQGTPEWLQDRLGKVTMSNAAVIMSKGRNGAESVGRINYRAKLVSERLTGVCEEGWKSPEMVWGNETEPLARLKYTLKTGNSATECGFFAHNKLEVGASPDGLVGEDGLLEIKCPNTATHLETLKKQAVPTQYYWQIMGQLWITQRNWCDFESFDPRMPENATQFITRVHRDDDAITRLENEIVSFLETVDREVTFVKNYKG